METGYLHLLINHWPILGSILFAAILLWGLVRRSDEVILLGLVGVLVVGVTGVVALVTGEAAEEAVERLAGIDEEIVELHEEASKLAMIPVALAAAAAFLALALRFRRGAAPRGLVVATLVLLVVVAVGMAYSALLGGKIRHTEFAGKPTASLQ